MSALPAEYEKQSLPGDPSQYSIYNARSDNTTSNSTHCHSNQNIGNVLNSYNHVNIVGVSEEFLRIQEWLSPLEPYTGHQDVRNRRLDGVGDWVL